MWAYQKKLEYPVKIANPNPAYARIVISQLGGPDGEMGAATRYLSQRYAMPYKECKAILTDIGASVPVRHIPRPAWTGGPALTRCTKIPCEKWISTTKQCEIRKKETKVLFRTGSY